MTGIRVAVLCSDDPQHRYLVAHLRSRFCVPGVVVEPEGCRRNRLLTLSRYRDYLYAQYHHLRTQLFRESNQYFSDIPEATGNYPTQRITVPYINDAMVTSFLRNIAPDVTVVDCTSILSAETLAAAGGVVLNIHGGCLPEYRGIRCMFWPLYRGQFDKLAATIHFVDSGIDTGAIVAKVVPQILPTDTAEVIYARAERLAIHRLVELLDRYEKGEALPRRPQPFRGPLYRERDRKPHHDLHFWIRRRTGRLASDLRAAGYLADGAIH